MYSRYNSKDKDSIYNYAKKIKNKSFRQISEQEQNQFQGIRDSSADSYNDIDEYANRFRKGGLGELVEELYFHYKPDNENRADFPEAEVELKVTPFKINKNGSLSAKERLIISMINYMKIVDMEFYNSNAWEKMKNILLLYYLWKPEINNRLDYIIKYVYMFSPVGKDLEIIKMDFYKIKQKVLEGKAHELSEGDTLYLGAATKASSSKDRTPQPFSKKMAKPRAFSLKNSYMTYILRNYVLKDHIKSDEILLDTKVFDLEEYVLNKIERYKGEKDMNLFEKFLESKNQKSKNRYSRLALEILGVKTKNAEEFEKANISVKAIRVEERNKIEESISFPAFIIMELLEEEWEDSEIYNYFSETKFLFIIYKKKGNNYYLNGAKFWNMPSGDINGYLKDEWIMAREIFNRGVEFKINKSAKRIYNNLPKKSNTKILHVRPHAQKSFYVINNVEYGNGNIKDSDQLPNGDRMTKQCFWLNNDYILKQIEDKFK